MKKINVSSILEDYGYSKYQYINMIIVYLFVFNDGLFASIISIMAVPTLNLYQCSNLALSVLSLIVFVGSCTGSFFCGYLSNTYGRIITTKIAIIIMFTSTILIGIFHEFYFIHFTLRYIIGVALGVAEPFVIDILVEYLPLNLRTFFLNFVDSGWGFGKMVMSLIILFFMPNYEIVNYARVYYFASLIPLLTLVLVFMFLKEGIRTMLLDGDYEEAFIILDDMHINTLVLTPIVVPLPQDWSENFSATETDTKTNSVSITKKKLTNEEKASIIKDINSGNEFSIGDPSLVEIFSPTFSSTSIIFTLLWFFC